MADELASFCVIKLTFLTITHAEFLVTHLEYSLNYHFCQGLIKIFRNKLHNGGTPQNSKSKSGLVRVKSYRELCTYLT